MDIIRQKLLPYAPLMLRAGLGIVFFLFGFQKLANPIQGTSEIQLLLEFVGLGGASLMNFYLGVIEILLALSLWIGFQVRWTAILAFGFPVIFFISLATKYGLSQDPTLNRDLGLAAGGLALWILGAGPLSIDAWLEKKSGKTPGAQTQITRKVEKGPEPKLPPPGVLQ